MLFTETGNGNASLWADFNSESQSFILEAVQQQQR